MLRARLAAYHSHLGADGTTRTAAARAAFKDSFAVKIRAEFPDLAPAEVDRRAAILRRAHYTRLALASSIARSRRPSRRARTQQAEPGDLDFEFALALEPEPDVPADAE